MQCKNFVHLVIEVHVSIFQSGEWYKENTHEYYTMHITFVFQKEEVLIYSASVAFRHINHKGLFKKRL